MNDHSEIPEALETIRDKAESLRLAYWKIVQEGLAPDSIDAFTGEIDALHETVSELFIEADSLLTTSGLPTAVEKIRDNGGVAAPFDSILGAIKSIHGGQPCTD